MKPDSQVRFAAVVSANGEDLLAYFARRVAPREDAADLVSETFMVMWRRVRDLPVEPERARMWAFGIASRLITNHTRGRIRRHALVDRLRDHLRSTQVDFVDSTDAHAVRAAVDALPAEQRELITLVHWEGFTVAESAEILRLNASTARSRYARAKEQLAAELGSVVLSATS